MEINIRKILSSNGININEEYDKIKIHDYVVEDRDATNADKKYLTLLGYIECSNTFSARNAFVIVLSFRTSDTSNNYKVKFFDIYCGKNFKIDLAIYTENILSGHGDDSIYTIFPFHHKEQYKNDGYTDESHIIHLPSTSKPITSLTWHYYLILDVNVDTRQTSNYLVHKFTGEKYKVEFIPYEILWRNIDPKFTTKNNFITTSDYRIILTSAVDTYVMSKKNKGVKKNYVLCCGTIYISKDNVGKQKVGVIGIFNKNKKRWCHNKWKIFNCVTCCDETKTNDIKFTKITCDEQNIISVISKVDNINNVILYFTKKQILKKSTKSKSKCIYFDYTYADKTVISATSYSYICQKGVDSSGIYEFRQINNN